MAHEATQTNPQNIQPPTRPSIHGNVPRGLNLVPRSQFYEGRFGRMFRKLSPLEGFSDEDYRKLASTMVDSGGGTSNNPQIPAGYTYLGQFIDHDITFDPTSSLQRENDPDALQNFRTPRFDLDSVYGAGPQDSPFMYEGDGVHLRIGIHSVDNTEDCLRITENNGVRGLAILGDPRNDENIIVNQIHLAFIKYHNTVVDELWPKRQDNTPSSLNGEEKNALFEEARRIVRWGYQWIVVEDFLKRTVSTGVVNNLFKNIDYKVFAPLDPASDADGCIKAILREIDLKFYEWKERPYMPVEFSVAAYRFGHSQVRNFYKINTIIPDEFARISIFRDENIAPPTGENPIDLRGSRERPAAWLIEWRRFFDFGDQSDMQLSRTIDTKLVEGLSNLPGLSPNVLAFRNLLRGARLKLPSGQAVARAMGIPEHLILKGSQIGVPETEAMSKSLANRFNDATPLWYYILKEAETFTEGKQLGPVGGRIVAEVLMGLLLGDPSSYLHADSTWRPETRFGAETLADGTIRFEMTHLLRFAGAHISDS